MADLITGLVAYLLTQESITALIAGGDSIQPIPAPVEATDFPAIVYQVVSDTSEPILTGVTDLCHSRILFSCLASFGPGSYLTAHNLGLAVKAALNGYEGTLPGGPQIYFAEVLNLTDVFQPDALLSATNVSILITYQD